MKAHRVARVAEVIREVAAETILFELQDPRIKNVTVNEPHFLGHFPCPSSVHLVETHLLRRLHEVCDQSSSLGP